ncbi:hypothetical protein [Nostoc sp. NOS(2021)]|uniref:hypothetical protein n=1 Tax=Nostoc sp. NOS(2021) TaxID=2815407 RepID=UPI0025E2A02D|nr:hypothetical protein [Nostoc sp. NOS(2021)]
MFEKSNLLLALATRSRTPDASSRRSRRQLLQVGGADGSCFKSAEPPNALPPQRTGLAIQTKPASAG